MPHILFAIRLKWLVKLIEIYLSHSGKVTHTFLLFLQNLLNIIAIDIILFFSFKYSSYEIICRKKT